MKQPLKQLLTILLAVALVNAVGIQTVMAADIPTRQADVTTPRTGNSLVPVRGNFFIVSKETVLNRINEIRKEACEQGVLNPETNQPLTTADFKPIKWSSALEMIAQTRAAEASVVHAHQRPNGTVCFTCEYNGEQSWAEDLAWNWSGMMEGIEQWYEEKGDWVNQTGAVTGHYTSMISPKYNYVALGCFRLQSGGWYAVSGEFSFETGLNETQVGVSGLYNQMIEVPTNQKSDYDQYSGKEETHTHSLVKTNAKSPTCTEAGNIAYWTCSTCHKVFSDQKGETELTGSVEIPATGHDWGEWVVTREATDAEEGEKQRVCRNDPSHKETEVIAKQLHTTPEKHDLSECTATLSQATYTYDGTAKTPDVTVKNGSELLHSGTDYTVSFTNNVGAGTATAVISGLGDYAGSNKKLSFTILKANQSVSAHIDQSELTVGATAQITAYGHGTLTYRSDDNSIANVDASGRVTAVGAGTTNLTVTASGDSNYNAASATLSISVSEKPAPDPDPTPYFSRVGGAFGSNLSWELVANGTLTISGKGPMPDFELEMGSEPPWFDYHDYIKQVVIEDGITSIGEFAFWGCHGHLNSVTIPVSVTSFTLIPDTVIYGYTNSAAEKFAKDNDYSFVSIGVVDIQPEKHDLSECTATLSQVKYTYDGSEKTPAVTVMDGTAALTRWIDYTVTYQDNVFPGQATVKITGMGDYTGSKVLYFQIETQEEPKPDDTQVDLSRCQISLSQDTYTYDGTAKTPDVIVMDGAVTLTEGIDYTVTYQDNVRPGLAEVIVTGIGNYTGEVKQYYSIEEEDDVVREFQTIDLETRSYTKKVGDKAFYLDAYAEEELSYRSSDTKVVTVSQDGMVTIKGAGEAVIYITAAESEFYYSEEETVTITVNPKGTSLSSVKAKKGKVTVKWKKTAGVTGYEVQFATDKSFKKGKKTVKIKSSGTISTSKNGWKKGSTCYVRVRTYKDNYWDTYRSGWSKVKSVKIK